MSWFDISAAKGSHPVTGTVRIAVEKRGITVRIATPIAKEVGWELGDRITALVGREDDFGLLRLARSPDGWSLISPGGGEAATRRSVAVKFAGRLAAQQTLPEAPERLKSTVVAHRVVDGMIEFALPWIVRKAATLAAKLPTPKPPPGFIDNGSRGITAAVAAQAVSVQPRSLAEVEPAPLSANLMEWPDKVLARFIDAVARGAGNAELAKICGLPAGSMYYLKEQVRAHAKKRTPATAEAVTAPAPKAVDDAPSGPPKVPPHILEFLRTDVVPVLAPLGHKVTKTRDGTGLLFNGAPISLEDLVAKVNDVLKDLDEPPLDVPAAA